MKKTRLVIVGGGFGGVKCAQTLRAELPSASVEIVLFNAENHLVFSPLLADIVGSSLNAIDVVVPLRQLLPEVFCRTEEVKQIDLASNEVEFEGHDSNLRRMGFDHLVIASGNAANLNVAPGMADHAFALKTVGDAIALRSHVMEQLEKAEVCDDPEKRRWYLSFIIVGGGYSGVEAAGEINDLVRSSVKYFQNFSAEEIQVTLVHSRDQLLMEIGPELREFARAKMEEAGVRVLLNERAALATPEGVGFKSGAFLEGATIVCTIGTTTAPVIDRLDAAKEKGRLLTRPDMRLQNSPNVWAIGDCANVINGYDGSPSPPTGQFAERQAKQCAKNIKRVMEGESTVPFSFKPLGQLCSIGGQSAVAELMGFRLSGFVAWFLWRGIYLFKLPTWARRVQVGFDWAWLLLFPRDLAHIRGRQTNRVSYAHYRPGDYIIKQGDPPTNFYVVESGEVEVIQTTENGDALLAVLGQGTFFGEQALINNKPRMASVRARTSVQVLVLGRNVFAQVSRALMPFKDALAKALNRRTQDPDESLATLQALLRATPVKEIMEAPPDPLLKPDATLGQVAQLFARRKREFFYALDDKERLAGVVTMTDLLRAHSTGMPPETPVGAFMTKSPLTLGPKDSCAAAASLIHEHGIKTVPVLERKELIGCVRARALMALAFKRMKQ